MLSTYVDCIMTFLEMQTYLFDKKFSDHPLQVLLEKSKLFLLVCIRFSERNIFT